MITDDDDEEIGELDQQLMALTEPQDFMFAINRRAHAPGAASEITVYINPKFYWDSEFCLCDGCMSISPFIEQLSQQLGLFEEAEGIFVLLPGVNTSLTDLREQLVAIGLEHHVGFQAYIDADNLW